MTFLWKDSSESFKWFQKNHKLQLLTWKLCSPCRPWVTNTKRPRQLFEKFTALCCFFLPLWPTSMQVWDMSVCLWQSCMWLSTQCLAAEQKLNLLVNIQSTWTLKKLKEPPGIWTFPQVPDHQQQGCGKRNGSGQLHIAQLCFASTPHHLQWLFHQKPICKNCCKEYLGPSQADRGLQSSFWWVFWCFPRKAQAWTNQHPFPNHTCVQQPEMIASTCPTEMCCKECFHTFSHLCAYAPKTSMLVAAGEVWGHHWNADTSAFLVWTLKTSQLGQSLPEPSLLKQEERRGQAFPMTWWPNNNPAP